MSRVVVVPCKDEARRLDVHALASLLDARTGLLLVDDGSTDQTRDILERFAAADPRVQVLVLGKNVGKGEAVRRGMLHAIAGGASVVGYLDADLATPPREMSRLLDIVEDERVRAAVGSRVALMGRHIERSMVRHYLGRVFATAAAQVMDVPFYDTQCGAKAFMADDGLRDALRRPFHSRWVFDVELLQRLLTQGHWGIVEVPLHEWRDVAGGKLRPRHMIGAGADLLRIALHERVRKQLKG